ncbi:MAG: hypothetical protein AMXMBFR36_22870 [Acidobacteriota bacterium]
MPGVLAPAAERRELNRTMSFDVDADDLLPATFSSLAWRWTRASHAVFSSDELSQVACLAVPAAREANLEALRAVGRDGLQSPPTSDLLRLEVPDSGDVESIRAWLRALPTGLDVEVVASWSAETALKLPWALFVRRWEDFCYPGSDDIAAFPTSRAWILAYHHENVFEWGRWRAV